MTTGQKFLGGILLGVAAGVAIALFVNSEKGKELLSDASDAAGEAGDNLKNKFGDYEGQMKDLLKKGKAFIGDIETKIKEFAG